MELDELKLAWQSLDARVEKLSTLEAGRQRQSRLKSVRGPLRVLSGGQVLQIVAGVLLCLIFAPYWVAHWAQPHLAIYGLALHAYGLMFIGLAARTLLLVQRVDYAAPVCSIQKQMASLTEWRARVEGPAFAIVGCFIWIPLLLILFRAVGADLWLNAPAVVWSLIASSFVCLGVVGLALRAVNRNAAQNGLSAWAKFARDSTIGRSIRRAQQQLDELAAFERGG